MLKLNKVTLAFGGNVILDNINLNFNEGEIIGLVAPNGMGKSTLLNVILNNLIPQEGFVEYNGISYKNQSDAIKLHHEICSFPEQSDLLSFMTGRDHLRLYADLWNNTTITIDKIIEDLQMSDYVDDKIQTYSLGMKQRLCFAMVVAANPSVMLLDEVMNGLDPQNIALISAMLIRLKKENKLIIIASHLLHNLQQYADRVLFLSNGQIINNFNLKNQTTQYLKIRVSPRTLKLLKKVKYEILPNEILLIPLSEIKQKDLENLLVDFSKEKIQFEVEPINIEDLFNKYFIK